ncbi:MAG: transporter substrate-binding domain-containing protein, partial [Solirubrobacteraceae bacterium]
MTVYRNGLWGRGLAAVAAAAIIAFGVGGMTAVASAHTTRAHGAVRSVAKLVPAAIKKAGTLTVAADATYAPDEFMQGQTVVGMDADLMKAIAKVMGLKVSIRNVTFDDIIPSMVAGRYMIGAS